MRLVAPRAAVVAAVALAAAALPAAAADDAIAMFWPAARPLAQGSLPLVEWAKAAPLAIAMLLRRPPS